MKNLKTIILTGLIFFSSVFSISLEKIKQPLIKVPLEEKLREIENDKLEISSGICLHKAMRYYLNAKAAGEDARLIIGWRDNSKYLHAWVGIYKNSGFYCVDPSFNSNRDSLLKELCYDRKEIYVFNSEVTIEEFINYKNIQRKDTKVKKESNKKVEKKPYGKEEKTLLIESLKDYCKQDTFAWNYYQEHIAKK